MAGEDTELLNLGITFDQGSFAGISASIEDLRQRIDRLSSSATAAFDDKDNTSYNYIKSLDAVKRATFESDAEVGVLTRSVQNMTAEYVKLGGVLPGIAGEFDDITKSVTELTNRQKLALGMDAGNWENIVPPLRMFDPAADLRDDISGGAGGRSRGGSGASGGPRGGSQLPVIFGLMSAGRMADEAGLSGLGTGFNVSSQLLSVEGGISQLTKILPSLNAELVKAPGAFAPLISGLSALGIPMAGLLGVILPVGAAVAGVVAAFHILAEEISKGQKLIQSAFVGLQEYYKTIQEGTESTVAAKTAKLQSDKAAADEELKQLTDIRDRMKAASMEQTGFIETIAGAVGLNELNAEIDKLQKVSDDAQAKIDGLNRAIDSTSVAANTAAEEARKSAEDHIQQSQRFAADDKMTVDAIKDKVKALNDENNAVREAIAIIEKSNQNVDLSIDQHTKNNEAIEKYNDTLSQNQEEIDHLTNSSLGLADALRVLNEGVDEQIEHDTEMAKLRRSGSADQIEGMIADKEDELAAIDKQISALERSQRNGGLDEDQQAKLDQLIERFATLRISINELNDMLPGVIEREFVKKQREEIADIQKNFNDKSNKIEEDYKQKEIDIHAKAAAKVEDIIRKEIEAREAALQKLYIKEADLTRDYVNDSDKARRKAAFDDIQAQRKELVEERDQLVEHLKQVQEIQRRFQSDGYEALLDRDYIALAKLRARYQEENSEEEARNTEAKQSLQNKLADDKAALAAQRQFEQNERRIAYENRIKEAQAQYEQDLENARAAKMRALELNRQEEEAAIALALQKRNSMVQILTDEYTASLRLAAMSRDARLQSEAQTQQMLIRQAQQYMLSIGETFTIGRDTPGRQAETVSLGMSGMRGLANGGTFAAGEPFIMSEEAPEMLMMGGRGYDIAGAAMVYPLQSGSVINDKGGKNITLAPTFVINEANNLYEIQQKIAEMLNQVM